jgi:hypothetical protein
MAQFSRRTILAATDLLPYGTHATMDRFLLDHGLDGSIGGSSKESRANALATHLIKNPDATNEYGENLTDAVVEAIITDAINRSNSNDYYSREREFSFDKFRENYPALHRSLERDGFTVEDGTIRRTLPDALELPQADDEVHALLDSHGFRISKGHLDQGIAAHARGDWAAANAQFRTFIESLFDEIARHYNCPAAMARSGQRRAWLAQKNPPFFIAGLNEWDFQGGGFMESFFRRLHPQGAHPGSSPTRTIRHSDFTSSYW